MKSILQKRINRFMLCGAAAALVACSPAATPSSEKLPTATANQPGQQPAEPQNPTKEQQPADPAPAQNIPSDPQENAQMDTFKTPSGKTVEFHCIKHGSIRIRYENTEIEVDPVVDLDGKITDYTKLPKADYILVTHEHYDHLDKKAIDALTGSATHVIANPNSAKQLGRGDVMKNGDKKQLADSIEIEAVPAYNTTPGHEKFHPKGRDNGYILTLDGFKVYIGADTEDITEMEKLEDYHIDVAFLPCNQPYTMTPDQLVHAAKMVKPKVLFPYHYSATDVSVIPKKLDGTGIDVRIRDYQ